MSNVIQLPRRPKPPSVASGTSAYDFWFDLLEHVPWRRRNVLIHQAYVLGLIDERDREIFIDAWDGVRRRR